MSVDRSQVEKSIERGAAWLLKQQDAKSGGWHPETYGAMRGGASATALALYVGSHLPSEYRDRSEWKRGLGFLLRGLSKRNCIACPDGTLDYPTYSTAMTLIATRRLGLEVPTKEREKLVAYLISAQLTETNGFSPDQIDYGGWDLLGGSGAAGITSGTNISVSRFAVQALSAEQHTKRELTIRRALEWAKRCQNYAADDALVDGGFFFHPTLDELGNKAQWDDDRRSRPRSYGTTTCDGISLMIAAGLEANEDRVSGAVQWLDGHASVEKVPGFEEAAEELGWDQGLKFYYLMVLSGLISQFSQKKRVERRQSIVKELVAMQLNNGSWQNESDRMREDDPHIATCFALIALSNLAET